MVMDANTSTGLILSLNRCGSGHTFDLSNVLVSPGDEVIAMAPIADLSVLREDSHSSQECLFQAVCGRRYEGSGLQIRSSVQSTMGDRVSQVSSILIGVSSAYVCFAIASDMVIESSLLPIRQRFPRQRRCHHLQGTMLSVWRCVSTVFFATSTYADWA